MKQRVTQTFRTAGRNTALWLKIAILVIAGIMPALTNKPVSAAQLTSRKVTINKSAISSTDVEHIFSYTIPTAGEVEGIMYRFCTTPLGTCTLPSNMSVQAASHDSDTIAGGAFTNQGNGANENDCDALASSNVVCFERTDATSVSGAVTHTISNITAPDTYLSVYIRISTYDDADFQTVDLIDQGVVASAYVRQLTVSGRVQERLEFCVATIDDDDATPANCAAFPSTTEAAIGTIDHNDVYVTPVEPTATNLANDDYGVAMINTNASAGVVLTYFPESASSVSGSDTHQLRRFRVIPTDCSATDTSVTDQCFISASTSGEAFTAGTERFGMQIPCIDTTSGTTTNLGSVPGAYNNADNTTTSSANCESPTGGDTGEEFAYDDSGTPVTLASSSSVVDDEMVKLRFGATASATTPEGSYLAIITYIATPTF